MILTLVPCNIFCTSSVLIEGLDDDPDSNIPYSEFLKAYDVPSLKLSVSYLYAISQFGKEDMLMQLDYLIEQSAVLSINEEKIRNEDALAGFSMLGLAPMLPEHFQPVNKELMF